MTAPFSYKNDEFPMVSTMGGDDITLLQQFFNNPACVLSLTI
jgi:hypothetical protein